MQLHVDTVVRVEFSGEPLVQMAEEVGAGSLAAVEDGVHVLSLAALKPL
jgi:hypothetical protein